jgi:hypothetical protein
MHLLEANLLGATLLISVFVNLENNLQSKSSKVPKTIFHGLRKIFSILTSN